MTTFPPPMADIMAGTLSQLDLDPTLSRVVKARAERWLEQVTPALEALYPNAPDVVGRSVQLAVEAARDRPGRLAARDRVREINPDWFGHEDMVGYVTYVDRFDGTLDAIPKHLDHLEDLGVSYLHLMPLLASRPHPNDGGYAVVDYREIDPAFGTMSGLRDLAATLHDAGISLCIDVVINHTAAEHHWAQRARAGEPRYRDYYLTFPDRSTPDAFERTLPEVFPDTAPGNFTFDEGLGRWVWTTFNPWQWDLNWANPNVFVEMLEIILNLAQVGVDVLRLDAIPFLWKRQGTNCQNLGEVHLILQALRGLLGIAAPAVAIKGEAIVAPHELVPYQGVGPRLTRECDLLYHNQLMVQGWSGVAAQDGRLATLALRDMAETPAHASWVTYVRCHDDIGWAIDDGTAAVRGWDGPSHRAFLSAFYSGELPYSYAAGANFQEDFVSGDRRTSGTCAALTGLSLARQVGDEAAVDLAVDRLILLHALAASYGGIPLIYMGDELGLDNDQSFRDDPDRAADNRWLHRPFMDWSVAARRQDPDSVEGRIYQRLAHLLRTRKGIRPLRAGGTVRPLDHDNSHVLAFVRDHPYKGRLLGLANFAETPQTVDASAVGFHEMYRPVDALSEDGTIDVHKDRLSLEALSMRWVVER